MASLDSLPADQRAVLQLVLQRGRTYDEIAAMLSIDRAAVRQRALDGFDALGPSNSIPAPQRALLTDYLLGQLPPRVGEQVHERLGASPPDRAWARMIASEIGPLTSSPLPEIPVGSTRRPPPDDAAAAAAGAPGYQRYEEAPGREPRSTPDRGRHVPGSGEPTSSRRGGAVLLGLAALAIVVIVIVVVATAGGSSTKPKTSAQTPPSTTTGTATAGTTGTTTTPTVLHTITMTATATGSKAAGVADVVREGQVIGLVIEATGVPANNTHNAYAVWLANSATDSKLVGFVNQRVPASGKLATTGPLPANATHYHQILLTLESTGKPKTPGPVVLEGVFSES